MFLFISVFEPDKISGDGYSFLPLGKELSNTIVHMRDIEYKVWTVRISKEVKKELDKRRKGFKSWNLMFIELLDIWQENSARFRMNDGIAQRLDPDGKWREVVEEYTDEGYTWVTKQSEKLF